MEGWNTSPVKKGYKNWSCSARKNGDLTAAFVYLKGGCKKDGDNLFSRAYSDRTRSNSFKLKSTDSDYI